MNTSNGNNNLKSNAPPLKENFRKFKSAVSKSNLTLKRFAAVLFVLAAILTMTSTGFCQTLTSLTTTSPQTEEAPRVITTKAGKRYIVTPEATFLRMANGVEEAVKSREVIANQADQIKGLSDLRAKDAEIIAETRSRAESEKRAADALQRALDAEKRAGEADRRALDIANADRAKLQQDLKKAKRGALFWKIATVAVGAVAAVL